MQLDGGGADRGDAYALGCGALPSGAVVHGVVHNEPPLRAFGSTSSCCIWHIDSGWIRFDTTESAFLDKPWMHRH